MNKFDTIRDAYVDGGFPSAIIEIWNYIFTVSALAPALKMVLPDILHQKLLCYPLVGYWPQIREPRSFNEKLMHRKLCTDDERFAKVEDKWAVREYVRNRVGEDILPDVYHVTDNPTEIPLSKLPDEFVIKPTHLSGPIIFVEDKSTANWDAIKSDCNEWLSSRHGTIRGEYWYQDIEPRIVFEERLRDEEHDVPKDFKFFVFHGQVEYIEVDIGRFSDHTRIFYNTKWMPQEFALKYPLGPTTERPAQFEKMIEVAELLGDGFDFIRVDLYQPNGDKVIFGEVTVAHGSGSEQFDPLAYDFELGSLW